MTPKSDHEEDMSMEEILASIRKFVTDNPPEDPHKRQVYKGNLNESVIISPAHHKNQEEGEEHAQSPLKNYQSPMFEEDNQVRTASVTPPPHPTTPLYQPDILELNNPMQSSAPTPNYSSHWTPPSRTPFHKNASEESIMTLTNPIGPKKPEKLSRPPAKAFHPGNLEEPLVLSEGLGSSHALAASANSLARLAQASKSAPKRAPNLADQRNVTLDQLIQDMIRPMIKDWIDTHLPSLVEEMVAKEIKRITKHLG